MAIQIGKRKSRRDTDSSDAESTTSSVDQATARALFQRAFEAKFKPLPKTEKTTIESENESEDDYDEEDAWDGLSEGEKAVEIIHVQDVDLDFTSTSRSREMKAFMSTGIPKIVDQAPLKTEKQTSNKDDGEAENLKNDMALQRLLKESHLLDASAYAITGSEVQGKSRLKALDLRIQDLGGKTSHLAQKNMPMSHRKGIVASSTSREKKRRKEAAENGIILEKVKVQAKTTAPRERGVAAPNIGKFRDGMLKLSNRDLKSIEGSQSSDRGRRKGRGR